MEFEEYYKQLGLESYPFSIYTAESEKEKSEQIYKKHSNYSVIDEAINGGSVIITGERGSGKTALNQDIIRRKQLENTLLVRLEEFSKLNESFDYEQVYRFITERIAGEFFNKISAKPRALWKYDKEDRLFLSMYLYRYVPASTRNQLREHVKKIQQGMVKRSAIRLYNSVRVVANYGMKAATKAISDALTKHFSALPEFDSSDAEYFKKLEIEVDESFTPEDRSYFYLEKLCSLILKSHLDDIIVVIDKMDEDPRFKNDSERIAAFIEGIASNNNLLINELFKVVFFVWTTPFNSVKSSIRTQKIALQELSWTSEALREASGKRLSAFSDNKLDKIEDLFEENSIESIDKLINMCNENPRDLWHLLDRSLVAQFYQDNYKKITEEAVNQGIDDFVGQFNYYEYYPRKSNARRDTMDVYSYIRHLLKLDSNIFTKDKLKNMAGTGGSTNNYVVSMENMGLIRRTGGKTQQGGLEYEIRDPKVRYARENGIDISSV